MPASCSTSPRRPELDRLWDELHFISQDALTLVDAFAQLLEYASQDGDPKVFEPLRKPINDRAAAFRRRLVEAEPRHLDALLDLRRPGLPAPLDRVGVGPASRLLRRAPGTRDPARRGLPAHPGQGPRRARRSSTGSRSRAGRGARAGLEWRAGEPAELLPLVVDARPTSLRELAESGRLADPDMLAAQTRRMLRDDKTRRLATEFACQWLHIADFDQLDEKSERHFPTFLGLRGAMYEESVRFFTDLFQNDGSVLDILDADHTFLNGPLAEHYGIPFDKAGKPQDWRRVRRGQAVRPGRGPRPGDDPGQAIGRLADQPDPPRELDQRGPARRTPAPTAQGRPAAPRRRGGDRRPDRPPARREARQRREVRHCHQRIDPLGFSLEAFDAIGRRRDEGPGRPADRHPRPGDGRDANSRASTASKSYLLTVRRDAFVKQFCRKLLGLRARPLDRSFPTSLLLADMQSALKANGYRVGPAIEVIVRSRQFREIRGRETAFTD